MYNVESYSIGLWWLIDMIVVIDVIDDTSGCG